ncbi:MAG: DNA helicase UvrD [Desulfobulbus propionicus]|nr:MAG: DNA helicase UvrD [Desulfobulbus propionicus]
MYTQPPSQEKQPHALNPAQTLAVTHGEGPILVIAGAGSGKTRTLVHRMTYLLDKGVPPESILLLTFTRRAAQEMLWRASQLSSQPSNKIFGGTFHATAHLLLRRYGHHLGLDSRFTIIDRGDAEGIINLIKSSLGFSGAGKRFPSKRVIMNLFSGSINKSTSIEDLVMDGHYHLTEFTDDFLTIFEHYRQFKHDNALMDYDDLLVNWQRLLTESDEARDAICNRFHHILVDEYQDTNLIQAHIVRLLATNRDNVMVVGDDAQSIYSFRGADFYNIIRFSEQFPGTSLVKLEENYRSTQPILQLTNAIISNAAEKFTKTLFSQIQSDTRPLVYEARDEGGEARFVVEKIKTLRDQGVLPHEIAVLFRSGFHSYKLEMELSSHFFTYEKRGGMKLTETAHIKDILSFFRILVNPWDTLSWHRILLQLHKVGPKTAQKIIRSICATENPIQALLSYKPGKNWESGFTLLTRTLEKIANDALSPSTIYDRVIDYYLPVFEKIYYDDYPKRRKELDQVSVLINGYEDLQTFVDDTVLDPPEPDDALIKDENATNIVLSTIHSAKGLEWDAVFVIGLAEGRFPHQNSSHGEQFEEERRLLYVAATRARKQLFLTYPCKLMSADRQQYSTTMSPFLQEIPPGLYVKEQHTALPLQQPPVSHAATPGITRFHHKKMTDQSFSPGMSVKHSHFGTGRVTDLPGSRKVTVAFDRYGTRTLHLDYTILEII